VRKWRSSVIPISLGVTTGLIDMDKYLGGLHPSDLLILAGRPSMGKTTLATNIAFNAAKAVLENDPNGAPVAFFSLEMSSEQLASRILASEAAVSGDKIRRGDIQADDFPRFVEVTRTLQELTTVY
jgi:replicative DNA helicase